MRTRNLLLRPGDHRPGDHCPGDHRLGDSPTPQTKRGLVWTRPPTGAARAGVSVGSRVVALVVAALMVLATVVVELAALALVPATASAAPTPVTAYVTNRNDNTVTPIDLATNTPGTPIPVGSGPQEVAITPDDITAYVTNLNG
jgi:YVTN family beta-propeller protein